MERFKFDYTLNIGNIISLMAFLIAMGAAWFQMKEDVHILQFQYQTVDKKVEEIKQNQESTRKEIKDELSSLRNQLPSLPPKTRN